MISDDNTYRILKLLIRGLGRLPVGIANFCADLMGLLWFRIDRRHRTVTLENIALSFPGMTPCQVEDLGKQVFKNLASIPFEMAWTLGQDKESILSHVTVKGVEHVTKAHAKGNGVIVVLCHMGNFEMMIASIAETGLKGYAIYRKLDFSPLDRLIREARHRFNVTMIPTIGASKKIDAVLKNNSIVGTLLDQNVDWYQGAFVDFFGRPACTHKGLAKLALRSKAVVMSMFTVRDRKTRQYYIEFLPEIPRQETGCPIKDLENNTQAYSTAIESMVRRHPDQYFWVHNRWKTKNSCPWPAHD